MIEALSLEPPVSEEPFLRRELGLTWTVVDEAELRSRLSRGTQVLICSEPRAYADVLRAAPDRSAVLFMISDEGYSTERRALADLPAVRSVYRQYAASPVTGAQLARAMAAFAGDAAGTSQARRTAIPNARTGAHVRARMRAWSSSPVPVHAVPLGYTHVFERSFVARQGNGDGSLFDVGIPAEDRSISVTFRGNRGLAQRIIGCERAALIPDSDVAMIDADWSGFAEGDVGGAYVDALKDARYALCPPGFVNNESFRYYEALLCGALPIEVAVALTHQGNLVARPAGTAYSWREGLARAARMPEDDRRRAVVAARTLVADALGDIRAGIRTDREG